MTIVSHTTHTASSQFRLIYGCLLLIFNLLAAARILVNNIFMRDIDAFTTYLLSKYQRAAQTTPPDGWYYASDCSTTGKLTRAVLDFGSGLNLAEILLQFFKIQRGDTEISVHMVYDVVQQLPVADSSALSSLDNSPVKAKATSLNKKRAIISTRIKNEPGLPERPVSPILSIVSVPALCTTQSELIPCRKKSHAPQLCQKHLNTNEPSPR